MSEFRAVPRVIDSHVHLYPPEVNLDPVGWGAAQGEPHWATLCTRRRKNGALVQGFPSVDELLAEMDRAGVERAVLLGWYWEQAANCSRQNRFFAECVRAHGDRLSAFATVQPVAGGAAAVAEMRRAMEDGLVGLGELSPHAQGYAADGAEFAAVLAAAAEWRWPVNLHVTDARGPVYPGRTETPQEDFCGLARAWPSVRFVLAHWGGGRALRDGAGQVFENVSYDTAASPLLYDGGIWPRFMAEAGVEKVLFGSDYPLNNYPQAGPDAEMCRLLDEVRRAGLSDEERAALFWENGRRLIGCEI